MRRTEFWERMNSHFGASYARTVAADHVFADLDGQTVDEALADGREPAAIWRCVCEVFEVPQALR